MQLTYSLKNEPINDNSLLFDVKSNAGGRDHVPEVRHLFANKISFGNYEF